MNASDEKNACPSAGNPVDDVPSIHDLLNEARVWLQYARGVTVTLADLVHESEEFDPKQLSLSLEAIAAMTQAGLERMGEAHVQWAWRGEP